MKVIVGVDQEGLYESALNMLARLRIPELQVELVHVVEPIMAVEPEVYEWVAEIVEQREKLGGELLAAAQAKVEALGMKSAATVKLAGFAAQTLLEQADRTHADLIAIGSTQKSKYGAFFLGSVGRTLTISSRQSLLIAKGGVRTAGPLKAVFATDHSPYAHRTAEYLLGLHPAGFGCLTVLTASQRIAPPPAEDYDALDVERQERDRLQALGRTLCERLWEADVPAEYKVVSGDVHEVIADRMQEEKADLLILGAHGHGFVERVCVGSTSLQEVVGTPYSVLLLRPPSGQDSL